MCEKTTPVAKIYNLWYNDNVMITWRNKMRSSAADDFILASKLMALARKRGHVPDGEDSPEYGYTYVSAFLANIMTPAVRRKMRERVEYLETVLH